MQLFCVCVAKALVCSWVLCRLKRQYGTSTVLSIHVQKPKGIIDIFNHLVMKTGKHVGLSTVLLAKEGCTNMYRDTE